MATDSRVLNFYEQFYVEVCSQALFTIGYEVHLICRKPLEIPILKSALKYLQRRIPVLHLRVKEDKDGQLIFYKTDEDTIDFEVCEHGNAEDVFSQVVKTAFKKDGSFWKSKVIVPYMNSENPKYPCKYKLFFGFHHAIADGTTNIMILKDFLDVLNNLVNGNTINDHVIGELVTGEWLAESSIRAKNKLQNNATLRAQREKKCDFIKSRTSPFNKLSPYDVNVPRTSQFWHRSVSMETTTKLIMKFREHKVSFNSGFTALVDKAIVKVLDKRNKTCKEIVGLHTLDARRHNEENKGKYGCCIGSVSLVNKISDDILTKFSSHASQIDDNLKEEINDENYNLDNALFALKNSERNEQDSLFVQNPENSYLEYQLSNMGNISSTFTGEGEHIEIESIFRAAPIHSLGQCFVIFLQTFRGRLLFTLTQVTSYISNAVTEELLEELIKSIVFEAEN